MVFSDIIGGDSEKCATQLNTLFWKKCEDFKGHNKWCILLTLGLVTCLLLCGSYLNLLAI